MVILYSWECLRETQDLFFCLVSVGVWGKWCKLVLWVQLDSVGLSWNGFSRAGSAVANCCFLIKKNKFLTVFAGFWLSPSIGVSQFWCKTSNLFTHKYQINGLLDLWVSTKFYSKLVLGQNQPKNGKGHPSKTPWQSPINRQATVSSNKTECRSTPWGGRCSWHSHRLHGCWAILIRSLWSCRWHISLVWLLHGLGWRHHAHTTHIAHTTHSASHRIARHATSSHTSHASTTHTHITHIWAHWPTSHLLTSHGIHTHATHATYVSLTTHASHTTHTTHTSHWAAHLTHLPHLTHGSHRSHRTTHGTTYHWSRGHRGHRPRHWTSNHGLTRAHGVSHGIHSLRRLFQDKDLWQNCWPKEIHEKSSSLKI